MVCTSCPPTPLSRYIDVGQTGGSDLGRFFSPVVSHGECPHRLFFRADQTMSNLAGGMTSLGESRREYISPWFFPYFFSLQTYSRSWQLPPPLKAASVTSLTYTHGRYNPILLIHLFLSSMMLFITVMHLFISAIQLFIAVIHRFISAMKRLIAMIQQLIGGMKLLLIAVTQRSVSAIQDKQLLIADDNSIHQALPNTILVSSRVLKLVRIDPLFVYFLKSASDRNNSRRRAANCLRVHRLPEHACRW
jgi:hypothetical protein